MSQNAGSYGSGPMDQDFHGVGGWTQQMSSGRPPLASRNRSRDNAAGSTHHLPDGSTGDGQSCTCGRNTTSEANTPSHTVAGIQRDLNATLASGVGPARDTASQPRRHNRDRNTIAANEDHSVEDLLPPLQEFDGTGDPERNPYHRNSPPVADGESTMSDGGLANRGAGPLRYDPYHPLYNPYYSPRPLHDPGTPGGPAGLHSPHRGNSGATSLKVQLSTASRNQ